MNAGVVCGLEKNPQIRVWPLKASSFFFKIPCIRSSIPCYRGDLGLEAVIHSLILGGLGLDAVIHSLIRGDLGLDVVIHSLLSW